MKSSVNQEKIIEIQEKWGQSIVQIGNAFQQKQDYKTLAKNHVEKFYGYSEETVLFKPTKARRKQFRHTFESALSYFIGDNPDFPNDKGFALNPWIKVRFENAGFILKDDYAIAMGNYFFTDLENKETKVEYTLGFYYSKNGKLKINLHHSSLPYPK